MSTSEVGGLALRAMELEAMELIPALEMYCSVGVSWNYGHKSLIITFDQADELLRWIRS